MSGSFIYLIVGILLFFLYRFTANSKTILIIAIFWMTVAGSLAAAGLFQRMPVFFLALMAITALLTFLCWKRLHTNDIPDSYFLAVHALRLPVEFLLHNLYEQGKIPKLMTYEGWNFDILLGLTAIMMLIWQLFTHKRFARILLLSWNIWGLISLTAIVVLAVLSSPVPIQQFGFEQPNVALVTNPYCLLPVFIVPMVYLSHFVLLKRSVQKN